MINKEQVQHIAKLARLRLSEEEIEKLQRELSSILSYVEKLNEVDVIGVEPTSHAVPVENVFRQDSENPENKETREKLVSMAPDKKGNHFKVKPVF